VQRAPRVEELFVLSISPTAVEMVDCQIDRMSECARQRARLLAHILAEVQTRGMGSAKPTLVSRNCQELGADWMKCPAHRDFVWCIKLRLLELHEGLGWRKSSERQNLPPSKD
jgi:hypothetical protein